ncbi:MAG TPA: acetate/propionate family kinase [Gammaproteobacteria bacterium]|nr:acetate/propionate family kinase [Gammaproteobacteria bacterium]
MNATRHILCLNSGSSSLKLALYVRGTTERCLAAGAVEHIGLEEASLRWEPGHARSDGPESPGTVEDHGSALAILLERLEQTGLPAPDAVGHRVVHGGVDHSAPERIDARLLEALGALVPLAPLHLPGALAVMKAAARTYAQTPQVACYDTAFHQRMPERARRLALPRGLWDQGVRRYGFHGLSYEYIVGELGPKAAGRVIIAHLGNGASLAAVRDGAPLDTTMGLTPTGGIMMGTRSGDLDPGAVIHLLEQGHDAKSLQHLTAEEAGLLGVSGISRDMKTLLERREHEPHAAQAVEMFCYQVRKTIGAYAAALGGLDCLVFTGGIGERAAPVRAEICEDLGHLGIRLDPTRNGEHRPVVSAADAPCTVRVMPTNEDLMVARHTDALVFGDA